MKGTGQDGVRPRTALGLVALGVMLVLSASPSWSQPAGQSERPPPPLEIKPTTNCPQDKMTELQTVITYVRSEAWTQRPGNVGYTLIPDTQACQVLLLSTQLTRAEERAVEQGAGPRLVVRRPQPGRDTFAPIQRAAGISFLAFALLAMAPKVAAAGRRAVAHAQADHRRTVQ